VGTLLAERGIDANPVIITNPVINRLYGDALQQSLQGDGSGVTVLQVPDGEEYKSLETAGRLYGELTAVHAERQTPILALGGGVISDLAGFVAATYLRGVPLVHLPTTLLAQVDSSIGGKVAVNHGQLKNKIGAFYQPRLVICDTTTLKTLPSGQLDDGLAEVIKSAVIRDKELFAFVEEHLGAIRALEEPAIEEVVFRTAEIKARVVEEDEKELGLRAILNYGHTVGHAIESVTDFKVGHGAAVAMGMVAAARIAQAMDIMDTQELARLQEVIHRAGLPSEIPPIDRHRIIEAMTHDKKVTGGRIRFVLPRSIGDVIITSEVSPSLINKVLGS